MFGPMILRQVQKYQRNKSRQQYQNDRRYPSREQEPRPRRQMREPAPPPPPPQMSEEERNFRLKEDDIMLDNETMKDYNVSHNTEEAHQMDYSDEVAKTSTPKAEEPLVSDEDIVPSGKVKQEDDGFELKDLFFEDEDDKES